MSNPSEFELDLDLQLLPAWARQPAQENKYSRFEGESDDSARGGKGRRPWGDREGGFRRDRGPRPERRDRPPGAGGPASGPGGGGRGERRPFPGQRDNRDRGPRRDFQREPRPEENKPLIPVDVSIVPDPKGVESLARQIKLTGRSYPLFEIASLILGKAERFNHEFRVRRGADKAPLQRLFVCSLDESLWLNEDEIAAHALKNHFATFYQTERVPTDPPKGTYTFVAQCGVTGALLGPPNLHEYQEKLRKIHQERCSGMPFEVYKSRVKIVKDEALVKQWVDEQSFKNEYTCLNVPEPLKLTCRDQVEAHFRTTHLPNLIREVDLFVVPAAGPRRLMSPELGRALRVTVEQQRRFPINVATHLSQQFASHGLHFFKVNKTLTHVCVSRPHYLDLATTVVSDGVRKIVDFITAKPGCSRKALLHVLAPDAPAGTPPVPAAPAPAPAPEAPAAPAAEGQAAPPAKPAAPEPTPEQRAVILDLHWLIHQGHVIEFSNGRMEMAKKPLPRPTPPPKPAKPAAAAPEAAATVPPVESAPAAPEPTALAAEAIVAVEAAESVAAEPEPAPPAAEPVPEPVAEATEPKTEPPAAPAA